VGRRSAASTSGSSSCRVSNRNRIWLSTRSGARRLRRVEGTVFDALEMRSPPAAEGRMASRRTASGCKVESAILKGATTSQGGIYGIAPKQQGLAPRLHSLKTRRGPKPSQQCRFGRGGLRPYRVRLRATWSPKGGTTAAPAPTPKKDPTKTGGVPVRLKTSCSDARVNTASPTALPQIGL